MVSEKFGPIPRIARLLGLPAAWLKAEAEAGRVPSLVVGRRRLARVDEVERAINERAKSQCREEAVAHG